MNKRSDTRFRAITAKALYALLAVATVLTVIFSLIMKAKLTEKQGELQSLAEESARLDDEIRRLKIELETECDYEDIENRARNELGMQEPAQWQKQSISTDKDDGYELYGNDNADAAEGISSLTEYFGFG